MLQEGGKGEESAPQAPDRECAREERHSRHKRETRETSDPTDGQTKESKGAVDEMVIKSPSGFMLKHLIFFGNGSTYAEKREERKRRTTLGTGVGLVGGGGGSHPKIKIID